MWMEFASQENLEKRTKLSVHKDSKKSMEPASQEKMPQEEMMKMITGEKVIKNAKDGEDQMGNGNKNAGSLMIMMEKMVMKFSVLISITWMKKRLHYGLGKVTREEWKQNWKLAIQL